MSETNETPQTTEKTQETPPVPNAEEVFFLINAAQINKMLSVLGKLPYESIFQAIDVLRTLRRVEVNKNENNG